MKAKHIAFLSLSVLAGTFASCTGSHEIKITGSVKNLDGGTIIYQKSIDGMFNSQSQDTLKLNTDSTFSLTLPSNGYEQIRLFLWGKRYLGSFIADGGNYRLQIDAAATHPISILEGKNEKNMEAAHYDLMGEHVRVQEAFKDEIYTTFGNAQKALSIPHCVIIGKDGEIKFKSAASPEDMEKLKSQLKEAAQTGA